MQKVIYTEKAPKPIGPYSQGIIGSGSLIFIAGQIPLDPQSGSVVEGDIKVQTRQAIRNLEEILKKGDSSLRNVVKTTVFLQDMNEFGGMNEVYAEYFGQSSPARSTVQVARLPKDAKVEIEAIALATAG